MNNQSIKKKPYEAPRLTVATFKAELGYATSTFTQSFRLNDAWTVSALDPWSILLSGGNNLDGGWIDNGENPWF